MKKREQRGVEIRAFDPDTRTFEAVAVVYNVVDDYNTRFLPGCFTESLQKRLPKITWAHDWSDVVGRVVEYRDTDTELTIIAELDDPSDVPRAKQALSQLRSGTITDVSVGFSREDQKVNDDGVTDFIACTLDEVACVLRGAVPGAKVLAMRSVRTATGLVDEDLLISLAKKVQSKEITVDEAKTTIDLAAVEEPRPTTEEENKTEETSEEETPASESTEEPTDIPTNAEIDDSVAKGLGLVN